MAHRRISVRLPESLREDLEREAAVTRKPESEIVRVALQRYLEGRAVRKTCLDLAKEVGLIGSAPKAPSDLSTNRKYFDAFGRR